MAHRPKGSPNMGPSFWVLSWRLRSALFFLSFVSRSYARTTHPPSPVVPKNLIGLLRRKGPMPLDGRSCSFGQSFLPGLHRPRQLPAFEVDRCFRVVAYLSRIVFARSYSLVVLFDSVSKSDSSTRTVYKLGCFACDRSRLLESLGVLLYSRYEQLHFSG
jgi:hypothetical protein